MAEMAVAELQLGVSPDKPHTGMASFSVRWAVANS